MAQDDATLLDLQRRAKRVQAHLAGMTKAAFLEDEKTQSAVLYELTIIGEAVKRLSPEFRDEHPAMPWRKIAGMRDILVHNYDDVDLDETWSTTQRDIPALLVFLEPHVPVEED